MKTVLKASIALVGAAGVLSPFTLQAANATEAQGAFRHPLLHRLFLRRVVIRRMTRALDLSGNQADQLGTLRSQTAKALLALRRDSTLSNAQRQSQASATLRTASDQARSVLTQEQRERLQKMQQRWRERHPR